MKERSSKKNIILISVFAALLLVLMIGLYFLNLYYVPECDELYFTAWRFDSAKNALLSRPAAGDSVIGLMHNGRLIGNFLGILESRIYFAGLNFLRAFLFVLGIAVLSLFAGRYSFGKYSKGAFAAAAFIVCMPKGFYANVWSWGVSYVNYVLPVIGYLAVMILLGKDRGGIPALILTFTLAFTSQLYMETFTFAMCVCAVFILTAKKYQLKARISAAAGFFAGAAVMFLNPGYRAVSSGGTIHKVDLSLNAVYTNAGGILRLAYFRHIYLIVLIGGLVAYRLFTDKRKKHSAAVAGMTVFVTAAAFAVELSGDPSPLLWILLFAAFASEIVFGCAVMNDKKTARTVLMNFAVSAATVIPTAALTDEMSDRLFFPCYILLCVCILSLLPEKLAEHNASAVISLVLCIAWVSFLLPIYRENHIANEERISYGLSEIENGADEVTLPLLPHPDYATNEQVGKGDLSFIVYRNEPFDVKLTFVPYEQQPNS